MLGCTEERMMTVWGFSEEMRERLSERDIETDGETDKENAR